ncbi:MAG: outer rane efflux protein [bacterium]|nr:outer rane efflux protein [bacterium]
MRRRKRTGGRFAVAFFVACAVAAGGVARAEPPRLTLKQAIDRALTQNPQVLQQVEELRRAQALAVQQRAGVLPTLTGNGVYTRIDNARTLTTPAMNGQPETTQVLQGADAVTANVVASVPLIAPQRWVQWSHARGNARVSELAVGDAKRQVALTVATSYLAILQRRREVELDERARDTAKAHAAYTHTRLLGGVGSRLDDVRARQELETDEQLMVSARLALQRAQETLGVLVASEGPVDAGDEPWFAALDARTATEDAPLLRVDLRQREERRKLDLRIVRDDGADYMPSLTASFAPIYTWPSTIFTPALSWQFQLVVTVPFYDGGLRYGLARERKAVLRQAELDLEGALRQTRSDLRIGDVAVRETTEALARARAAAALAHEAVQIADLAYHAGATTNLELIDAERRARDADTASSIVEDAARQARVDLLFAAGRLP